MATLYLIRHAEPTHTGVLLGQLDPGLSPHGRQQAATLANLPVEQVWSSPLRRARQTANHINRPIIEIPELRELHQGDWTGKSWIEIEANWPDQAASKLTDWLHTPAPGGETWPDFLTRIALALHRIQKGPFPAAVVAHQAVNAALRYLIDARDPLTHTQQYGEIIELELRPSPLGLPDQAER